jgi:hypothetical protein
MNSGGYGSICKKSNHRPGSLLITPLSSFYETHGMLVNKSKVNVIEGFEDTTRVDEGGKRFVPEPPVRSLSYRFDGINTNTPNAYAEFTSSTEGLSLPRYKRGQTKEGATKGCTSCIAPKLNPGQSPACSAGTCGVSKLDPILDPKFNLREVAKHMILLEDHLFQPGRRCDDCINKHRLALEAFLEEAITLDKTGEYQKIINSTLVQFRQIMKEWVDKVRRNPVGNVEEVYFNTAQKLRTLRKPLCMSYCDFC